MTTITKYLISIMTISVINCYSQPDNFQETKKYIELSTDIKMAYVELGESNSEIILLLHGYTDSSRSFQLVMEELSRLNPQSRIIVPDLRGHGSTEIPESDEDFKLSDFSSDILSLINQLNLEKVHLVGHSYGSMIAQDIALQHPERIKSLVLIGTSINGKKNVAVQEFLFKELVYGRWKDQLEKIYGSNWKAKTFQLTPLDLGKDVIQFLKENWVTEPRANPIFLDAIYEETIRIPLITWFETLKTITEFDTSKILSNLKTPTLVIWGEDDELMPKHSDQQDLKNSLQSANNKFGTLSYYKTYKKRDPAQLKIGHNLHWAFPKEIAADIISFTHSNLRDASFESEIYSIKEDVSIKK